MSETTPDPTTGRDTEPENEKKPSDLDKLNPEGLGATVGEKDTFEPEESEGVE